MVNRQSIEMEELLHGIMETTSLIVCTVTDNISRLLQTLGPYYKEEETDRKTERNQRWPAVTAQAEYILPFLFGPLCTNSKFIDHKSTNGMTCHKKIRRQRPRNIDGPKKKLRQQNITLLEILTGKKKLKEKKLKIK